MRKFVTLLTLYMAYIMMCTFLIGWLLAPFDPTKKKKEKKAVIQNPMDEEEKLAEKTENLSST